MMRWMRQHKASLIVALVTTWLVACGDDHRPSVARVKLDVAEHVKLKMLPYTKVNPEAMKVGKPRQSSEDRLSYETTFQIIFDDTGFAAENLANPGTSPENQARLKAAIEQRLPGEERSYVVNYRLTGPDFWELDTDSLAQQFAAQGIQTKSQLFMSGGLFGSRLSR